MSKNNQALPMFMVEGILKNDDDGLLPVIFHIKADNPYQAQLIVEGLYENAVINPESIKRVITIIM